MAHSVTPPAITLGAPSRNKDASPHEYLLNHPGVLLELTDEEVEGSERGRANFQSALKSSTQVGSTLEAWGPVAMVAVGGASPPPVPACTSRC